MEKKFKKGEIVWAKMRGFSWWPGCIKTIYYKHKQNSKEEKQNISEYFYSIEFFGDNSHGELPEDKIGKFKDNFTEYSNTKQKKLLKAVEMAKKVLNTQQINKTVVSLENKTNENFLGKKTIMKGRDYDTMDSITNATVGSSAKNIKINININVTNNNHNTINISSFSDLQKTNLIADAIKEQQQLPLGDLTKGQSWKSESSLGNIDKEKSEINNNCDVSEIKEEEEEEEEEEETSEEKLRIVVNSFLRSRIDIPSASSAKYIISSIDNIENKLKDIPSSSPYSVYALTKDIISILLSLTTNDNPDIYIKSSQLISLITDKTKKELFDLSIDDLHALPDIDKSSLLNKDIIDTKITEVSFKENQSIKRRQKNKERASSINRKNSIEPNPITENEGNDKEINDLMSILQVENYMSAKEIFDNLSQDFWKNIYVKKHEDMTIKNTLLRKVLCKKMLKILKQIKPLWNNDELQRMVIYFEYKEQMKDCSFGVKYLHYIEGLCNALRIFYSHQYKKNKINEGNIAINNE